MQKINKENTLFWFRRDLRLNDNIGLNEALKSSNSVIPLFIFDKNILNNLDKDDKRVSFLFDTLRELNSALNELGSSLLCVYDTPSTFFSTVDCKMVFCNKDYEPYAKKRDSEVENILNAKGIGFHCFKDQVIFEESEILKNDGNPYTVFTPYSRKWKENFKKEYAEPKTSDFGKLLKFSSNSFPSLESMGFTRVKYSLKNIQLNQSSVKSYGIHRDIPSKEGTSNLSVYLRFGNISVREVVQRSLINESLLNEIIWREFFMMILYYFPHVINSSFRKKYDDVEWRNSEDEFTKWCEGKTGYPIVDAGMRELNATGYMHNRVRMVTAGFLCKHLLIHWSWGEAYFASKLMDYELSSNNGNWQWAAGTGCDAAPYFRVFNPESQQKKFDPNFEYIKKWVPEFGTDRYPKPVVDHKFARERAIEVIGRV